MKKATEKKLARLEGEYPDEDSQSVIRGWRDSLNAIEFDKAYSNLKNTRELLAAVSSRVVSIDKSLLERRKLSVEDREYLLGVKDAMTTISYWLDPKDYGSREAAIESEMSRAEKGELGG